MVQCAGMDSIDERIIGCSKKVIKGLSMVRPSQRVPYMPLCQQHRERLLRHNCCPKCGLFCTRGHFSTCLNGHTYHRQCEITVGRCPHCCHGTVDQDVLVSMHCHEQPVFLPIRKTKLPTAKMTISKSPVDCPRSVTSPPLVAVESKDYNSLTEEYEQEENGALLHAAVHKNDVNALHFLVQAGVELDVFDNEQNTPLMLAVVQNFNEAVRYLVRAGADVRLRGTDGMTALHLATKCGNIDAVRILLDSDVHACINAPDDGGWTPLVWACEHGHEHVVRELLRRGADSLIRDVEHNVSLHWAAFNGSSLIAQMLIDSGCSVNVANAHGDTPLHVAARQQHYNCTLVLLLRGADIDARNSGGEVPADCCSGDCLAAISLNQQLRPIFQNRTRTILTNDITKGKEANPVQCINTIDDEDVPADFVYITHNCPAVNVHVRLDVDCLQSCRCKNKCDANECRCMHISLGCWYDGDSRLNAQFNYSDPPMIFECNFACDCNAITCNNRLVQHGPMQRFQVFRTAGKGWGLRSVLSIPKGSFVCEYIGEIISDSEADHREDDSYLFDLDNRDGESYCIDARRYGNLSRFINHSCEPNLLPMRVFIEHQDLRFPRIAFFANRDISADEELSFDYGEKFWLIKYKSFTCLCQKNSCKYSQQTIATTLENYNRKQQEETESASH